MLSGKLGLQIISMDSTQLDRPHKKGGQGWNKNKENKQKVKKKEKLFVEVAKSGQIMFIPDHIPVFMEIAQPSFPY